MKDPVVKKRNSLIAALLSLIAVGLGQIYNGQLVKALIVLMAYACAIVATGMYLPATYAGLLTWALIIFLLYIGQVVDAFLSSRNKSGYSLQWYNRVVMYIVFFILSWGLYVMARSIVKKAGYEMFNIPTAGMDPVIEPGDRIVVRKWGTGLIKRGDILVFRSPYDGKTLIKRCVAIANDTVEIRHKGLFINGKQVAEARVTHVDSAEYPLPSAVIDRMQFQQYWEQGKLDQTYWVRDNFNPVVVPAGHLFTLGDNRDNSFDSRFWGPLDESAVIGKPLYIYFSKVNQRIGTTLH
jgi:signal peptidase I